MSAFSSNQKTITSTYLMLIFRLLLGLLFIFTGASKLIDLSNFQTIIANYKIIPNQILALFSYSIVATELWTGLFLTIGLYTKASSQLALIMILLFSIAIAYGIVNDINTSCGCFASLVESKVGISALARNLLIALISLYISFESNHLFSIDDYLHNKTLKQQNLTSK
jgi:uncharacterized membrane protein YphA (DoxX/SURF4 family)